MCEASSEMQALHHSGRNTPVAVTTTTCYRHQGKHLIHIKIHTIKMYLLVNASLPVYSL